MGNFYTNIVVKPADQNQVVDLLKKNGNTAYVSPSVDGAVVVYDEASESQDDRTLTDLTQKLSKALRCSAIAFLNHDDDILMMSVWANGEEVDSYNSCPDYFEPMGGGQAPQGGDPQLLCELFDAGGNEDQLESVLRGEDVFEFERHEAILETLGLPEYSSGYGYDYLKSGETPAGFEKFKKT